jgi:VWFA-related protein
MTAGRDELLAMLTRLSGRNVPDTSPERMSDAEALRIHLFRDPVVMERVRRRYESYGVSLGRETSEGDQRSFEDPFVAAKASEVYYQASTRTRATLEVLTRLLDSLAAARGRKSVVLVSPGFIYDPHLDEFKRVVQASRRGNAAVYYLDARGLDQTPLALTAQFGPPIDNRDLGALFSEQVEASEGSEAIAADSGGFSVRNTNDLPAGIRRIADESRVYYLLGYSPTNAARDGRFRKIDVKVAMKDVQVRARKGYYAPGGSKAASDAKPRTVDPDIQAALDSPFDLEQIPLRMSAFVFHETVPGKAAAVVATDVDIRGFAFEEKDGRFVDALEFLLVVAHRETGEFFRYDQKIDMNLLPSTRERLEQTAFTISRDFELKPGGYQAKIVARDRNSGRLGTVVHDFEVPELDGLRVSTPVLTDLTQAGRDGAGPPRPVLVVRRDFRGGPDSVLFCSVEVYGAATDGGSGPPRVSLGYKILRPDGSVLSDVEPTPIRPTSTGKLSRLIGTSLEPASPGDYEMLLTVRDERAGKTLEVREPFRVVAGGLASSAG